MLLVRQRVMNSRGSAERIKLGYLLLTGQHEMWVWLRAKNIYYIPNRIN